MKKRLILSIVTLMLTACGESDSSNPKAIYTEEGKVKMTAVSEAQVKSFLKEFNNCLESAPTTRECRFWTAKMICDFHSIKDFKLEDGSYLEYSKILDHVRTSKKWSELGSALEQDVLDKAQEFTNHGQVVLAIQTEGNSGHVAMLIPGELKKSSKWGIKAPNVASLFMTTKVESFYDKPISYAWAKPKEKHIVVYVRQK